MSRRARVTVFVAAAWVITCLGGGIAWSAAPLETGHPLFLSPHYKPIALHGAYVYAVNTPSDTVDVIDTATQLVVKRIHVGIDPVSIAVKPDGNEIWVANHVSDSISVIDSDASSATFQEIIATVQEFDPATKATEFDEPVGIAFASNGKAYVALSSTDRIAIIDVASRTVTGHLAINAQDPRAIAVHADKLYVLPFESNNQTQLSGCSVPAFDPDCTFNAIDWVLETNDVLSENYVSNLITKAEIPDRDLYVFDTASDQLLEIVDTVGTLLYSMAIDSQGKVFVAQTDARNDANGLTGTAAHGLPELENRAFLNQITVVDGCPTGTCNAPTFFDLEPLPPTHPAPGMALATPFGIQISADDATLVATAASSSKLFTVNAATGQVLGRVDVGLVPRGLALESAAGTGAPSRAWVLNTVDNSVSVVDVSTPAAPAVLNTIVMDDPTDPELKLGRAMFNDANAPSTGPVSGERCHPGGHSDQLLWVLDTPPCNLFPFPAGPGCDQIVARSTMPIRGLSGTEPYHWDGIPGDPYGGNNTANVWGSDPPNCSATDPVSCARVLVDGSMGSTMCEQGNCPQNDEGKDGLLDGVERTALSKFILSVPYPPSQERPYTNEPTSMAMTGFNEFHIVEDCGQCHRMPFWVSTGTVGTGMDAPTWRGAYDRWLLLPQGRLNIFDIQEVLGADLATNGFDERTMWGQAGASDNIWQMVLEGSTGFSGSFARQVTLNDTTARTGDTAEILDALESSALEGSIVLQAEGVRLSDTGSSTLELDFIGGTYRLRGVSAVVPTPGGPVFGDKKTEGGSSHGGSTSPGSASPAGFSRADLIAMADAGELVITVTGRVGKNVGFANPQPMLWTAGGIHEQELGGTSFPSLETNGPINIRGRHIEPGASLYVDGRKVEGSVTCAVGSLPDCTDEDIVISLASLPQTAGLHLLQVQNPDGLFSNDYIFIKQDPAESASGAPQPGTSGPSPTTSPGFAMVHGFASKPTPPMKGVPPVGTDFGRVHKFLRSLGKSDSADANP